MALVYYPLPRLQLPDTGGRREKGAASYGKMDRIEGKAGRYANAGSESSVDDRSTEDRPVVAAALAATSICIRPTMLVFWGYLHLERSLILWTAEGWLRSLTLNLKVLLGGLTMVVLSTAVDWLMMGRLTFPVLTFFHRNVLLNISTFYGATDYTYHFVQSLPIMLFPVWYWWAKGFAAALLPESSFQSLARIDTTSPLRALARATTFAILALSFSPHSEWRFLHPLLPVLLLFALPAIQQTYVASPTGGHYFFTSLRQYCRFPRGAWLLVTLAPVVPYFYLNAYHGGAQVDVINRLQAGLYGDVDKLVALMPCHSTPWASHLGNISGWFLTCEPPLEGQHSWTQQELFYHSPVSYIEQVFPYPPMPLDQASVADATPDMPSHVILFGELLQRSETVDGERVTVAQALQGRGYNETAVLWNGFDVAQDEEKRRGAVRVWSRGRGPAKDEHSW